MSAGINIPRRDLVEPTEQSDDDEILSSSVPTMFTGRKMFVAPRSASPPLSSSFTSRSDWRSGSRSSAGSLSCSVDRMSAVPIVSPTHQNYEVSPVTLVTADTAPKKSNLTGWSIPDNREDRTRRFIQEGARGLAREPSALEVKRVPKLSNKEDIVRSLGTAPAPPSPTTSFFSAIFPRKTSPDGPHSESSPHSPSSAPTSAPSANAASSDVGVVPSSSAASPSNPPSLHSSPVSLPPSALPVAVATELVAPTPSKPRQPQVTKAASVPSVIAAAPAVAPPVAATGDQSTAAPTTTEPVALTKTQQKKLDKKLAKKEKIRQIKAEKFVQAQAQGQSQGRVRMAPAERNSDHPTGPGGQRKTQEKPGQTGRGEAASSVSSAAGTSSQPRKQPRAQIHQPSKPMQYDDKRRVERAARNEILALPKMTKEVALFSHLQQVDRGQLENGIGVAPRVPLHPSIMRLGLKYADRTISGSNARCFAMLLAFKDVISDFTPAADGVFQEKLHKHIGPAIQFLKECRPMSVSMGNAILWLKNKISKLKMTVSDKEARTELVTAIDAYIERRITKADECISREYGSKYVVDGDVILTYATSHVVLETFIFAKMQGRDFSVVIADSAPNFEGRVTMKRLIKAGIPCSYLLINAVPYIIRSISKVMFGASAFMNNGNAISRVGTAAVALIANQNQVPVIFFCEIYKFCERALLDSICFNELAQPDKVLEGVGPEPSLINSWRTMEHLRVLNLEYDVTPSTLIDMIVTESGIMPPTSVPAVTREIYSSIGELADNTENTE